MIPSDGVEELNSIIKPLTKGEGRDKRPSLIFLFIYYYKKEVMNMNKFTIKSKLSSCQEMIDDLNENIDAFNELITEFKEVTDKLEFDGDTINSEYVSKSKVQVDGFNFLIRDRLALFKESIMKNAMKAEDKEVEEMVAALRKELETEVEEFKTLFKIHNLGGKAT